MIGYNDIGDFDIPKGEFEIGEVEILMFPLLELIETSAVCLLNIFPLVVSDTFDEIMEDCDPVVSALEFLEVAPLPVDDVVVVDCFTMPTKRL